MFNFSLILICKVRLSGMRSIKAGLGRMVKSKAWLELPRRELLEVVEDPALKVRSSIVIVIIIIKVTEGEIFTGVVDWCVANTNSERESKTIFQQNFEAKFLVGNISIDMFKSSIRANSHFLSPDLFREWTYEVLKNEVVTGTRFSLILFKVHSTEIDQRHFLDPVKLPDGGDFNIWQGQDEFPEIRVELKIYQKVSDGTHAPLGKFGIFLQTTHTCKEGFKLSSITERVSIKMVARKEDGSVVKKTFKPVEDSCSTFRDTDDLESASVRKNTFVLSKNREERLSWKTMEVVTILDRRAKCNINAITQEHFAEISASGLVKNYLQYATKFSFDVNMSLEQALKQICEGLKVKNICGESAVSEFCYWHYIFTKGFVGILRSSRATPGETWTATTVSDYLRCKVINHPIGVDNAVLRRSAFKTWIIAEKEAEEVGRKEKRMFVCTYSPLTETVTYAKKFSFSVEAKTETLGMYELASYKKYV